MEYGLNQYKGLNLDTSYDSITGGFYIDALDIRITTTKGESQGSITNRKGNTLYFDLNTVTSSIPVNGVRTIIGSTSIRNTIILFLADDSGENGWIITVKYNEQDNSLVSINEIYANTNLNFDKSNPIEAAGRFESGTIQRIYWTDYNNYLRSINIADPNVNNYPPELIDIFPNVTYTQPLLTGIQNSGNLEIGVYQYAYRLITADGKQTLVSPPSPMIHLSTTSEVVDNVRKYSGNAQTVIATKAHEITVDTSNYQDFESIELISIFKKSITGSPIVQSIETKGVGTSTTTFLHTGNEGTIIDLDTFTYTTKQYAFKTCKTLTPKDNSLVVANIKSGAFDLAELIPSGESFDARTGRYNTSGNLPFDIATGTPEEIEEKKLKNAFNIEMDSSYGTATTLGYNSDAHWDYEWHTTKQFKYQSNGTTLGGEGSNISYKFFLEQRKIDSTSIADLQSLPLNIGSTPSLNDGYTYTNLSFENNASPYLSGVIRGYKRGETYRFGIVFYNKKGEASFVEYIGDIKFPDISDRDDSVNNSATSYFPVANEVLLETYGYSLGVEFTIDFSTCPTLLDNISGYQIVRLERTEEDMHRVCSGIIRTGWNANLGASTGDYDLKQFGGDGSADIVHLFSVNQTDDGTPSGLGSNGNFFLLNNKSNASLASPSYDIFGNYISFCSPEVSYQFGDTISNINNQSKLLITGAYEDYYSRNSQQNPPNNTAQDSNYFVALSAGTTTGNEDLGANMADFRRKLRTTGRIDKETAIGSYNAFERGVEYVKQFAETAHVLFDKNEQVESVMDQELVDATVGPFDGYYFRNFYNNLDGSATGSTDLNNPNGTGEWFKGASSIMARISKISTYIFDPSLGALPLHSNEESFDTGNVYDIVGDPPYVARPTVADGLISTPILDVMRTPNEYYGGFTQNALELNTFIPASPFIEKPSSGTTDTFIVFGGDIFVDMWTFQDGSAWLNTKFYQNATGNDEFNSNRTSTVTLPIESRVNLALPYGATVQRGVKKTVDGTPSSVLHEKWRQETKNNQTDYGKSVDMYIETYNEVYSVDNKDLAFFIKPQNFDIASNVNDIRAYISNVKINQEAVDSWSQFGINNYYDVDDHGPINKIVDWGNFVHFFQDTAVGKYSINPRAVVATADGIPTELGSGEGFQDHIYYSTEHGSIHQWAVTPTDTGIYYFDGTHKKLFVLGQGNSPLSEIKGVHSLLNNFDGAVLLRKENGGDNPILNQGVHIVKDKVNDEVIMTFLNTNKVIKGEQPPKYLTLAFDELAQQFSSFYSNNTSMYVENDGILLSVDKENKTNIYLENSGNYGEFYGDTKEAYIKLVLNKDADINKILRFVEFNSIVRDDDKVIDRFQTITGFRVETEYQDTGKITDLSRIKRRFDKWRLKIPRNSLSSKKDRLRSTHFILTLYFDNSYNKELILNRILYFFNKQMY